MVGQDIGDDRVDGAVAGASAVVADAKRNHLTFGNLRLLNARALVETQNVEGADLRGGRDEPNNGEEEQAPRVASRYRMRGVHLRVSGARQLSKERQRRWRRSGRA